MKSLWMFPFLLCLSACRENKEPLGASLGKATDALAEDIRSRFAAPPLAELAFVPAETEALLRLDLAALGQKHPESTRMLDFFLHAQQPAVWEFLGAARLGLGTELRSVCLIAGSAPGSVLLAGIGTVDLARVKKALRDAGGAEQKSPAGTTMRVWEGSKVVYGVNEHQLPALGEPHPVSDVAVGVAEGLVLFGSPHLVGRTLESRVGLGRDLRYSPVARDLMMINPEAIAWGAAAGDTHRLAGGLVRARFQAVMDAGDSGIDLYAEFASAGEAEAFRGHLNTLIESGAALAAGTPMGKLLGSLRDTAKITVAAQTLTAVAKL